MRLLSFLVTTGILLLADAAPRKYLNPKGPPCPQGDGMYAVGCSKKYLECVNDIEFERDCPGDLYFDRLLARCDSKHTNFLCTNQRQGNYKPLNVRQKVISMDCADREGIFPMEKGICAQVYYECYDGRSFQRKCPYNQMFSAHLNRCSYEQDCYEHDSEVSEHGPARAYAALPDRDADNYVVTAHEVPEEDAPFGVKCADQGDSIFTNLTCSPYFWQCANGKMFKKSCPPGLIYVLSQNLCDYPQGIKTCPEYDGSEPSYQQTEQPRPATTTPAYVPEYTQPTSKPAPVYAPPATTTQGYVPPTVQATTKPAQIYIRPVQTTKNYLPPTTTTSAPSSTTPPPANGPYAAAPASPVVHDDRETEILARCNNKENGMFEISSCYKSFLSCNDGVGRIISCAEGLAFDARITSCEYPDKCKAPRQQEDVPVLYNHGGVLDNKPKEVKVDFDCTKKDDGHFTKEACTNEYFLCSNKIAFRMTCPENLVFNRAINNCDHAHNCEKSVHRVEIFNQYEQDSRLYMEPTQMYGNQVDHDDSREEEEEEEAEKYLSTTTTPYTKPPTTRPSTQRPVYTQPSTTTIGYEQPSTTKAYVSTTAVPYTSTTQPDYDDFSCVDRVEGNYPSGFCKSVFYTCSNIGISAFKCKDGLKFNPYNGVCDWHYNNKDCQSEIQLQILPHPETPYQTAPPTTTTAAPVYQVPVTTTKAPVYAESSAPVETYQPVQPPKHAVFCERLADGNYGKKCQPYFFQCANFETTVIVCPKGLFYSANRNRCDEPENVEDCPGYVQTTTPAQDDTTTAARYSTKIHPNIDYTTPVPGPIDTTPIAEAFSCSGRPDGIYALPYCSSDFVQCMAGRPLITACGNNLYYSEKSGLCDYKHNVPICGIRKGADIIVEDACVGMSDGYYSAGCSAHYFSCIGEQTRKMVCPNKLKFSQKKSLCDYPTVVEECGIASSPETGYIPPPAVPADFCTIRPSGLHAFGQCSAHYVVCEHARAIAGTCAAPLAFNAENQLCDYKSNNKECGSDYVPTAAVQGYSATESYATAPMTTTRAYVPPSTTTGKPYYPSSTTTTPPASDVPETTTTTTSAPYTTKVYTQPSTTTTPYTTTTTTTTTTAAPTTTTEAYVPPTTTTTKAYAPPTTTTTEAYVPPTTTTTEAYVPPTTTTTEAYVPPTTATTTSAPTTTVEYTTTTTEAYTQPSTTTTTSATASDETTVLEATTTEAYTQPPTSTESWY